MYITYIQDCYCCNYDIKKASRNNGINRYNIGKELNKTKLLIKSNEKNMI